jgi:hypothetical protein
LENGTIKHQVITAPYLFNTGIFRDEFAKIPFQPVQNGSNLQIKVLFWTFGTQRGSNIRL